MYSYRANNPTVVVDTDVLIKLKLTGQRGHGTWDRVEIRDFGYCKRCLVKFKRPFQPLSE